MKKSHFCFIAAILGTALLLWSCLYYSEARWKPVVNAPMPAQGNTQICKFTAWPGAYRLELGSRFEMANLDQISATATHLQIELGGNETNQVVSVTNLEAAGRNATGEPYLNAGPLFQISHFGRYALTVQNLSSNLNSSYSYSLSRVENQKQTAFNSITLKLIGIALLIPLIILHQKPKCSAAKPSIHDRNHRQTQNV